LLVVSLTRSTDAPFWISSPVRADSFSRTLPWLGNARFLILSRNSFIQITPSLKYYSYAKTMGFSFLLYFVIIMADQKNNPDLSISFPEHRIKKGGGQRILSASCSPLDTRRNERLVQSNPTNTMPARITMMIRKTTPILVWHLPHIPDGGCCL